MKDLYRDPDGSPRARNSILIVDDTIANLLAFSAILKPLDCRIVLARSGQEALKCALNGDFDVILMDIRMPEMNGFETATLIRRRGRTRDVPILFTSAYEVPSLDLFADSLGPNVDFIPSPVDSDLLLGKVSACLKKTSSDEPADPSDPNLQKSPATRRLRPGSVGPVDYEGTL